MKKNLLKELEEFVNGVLDISGTIALENFREIRDMTLKGDSSPVTKADMEIEQYIRTKILEKYPNHNIVGEELDYVDGSENVTWYIDPIDGTRSFVAGKHGFGTHLAVVVNNHVEQSNALQQYQYTHSLEAHSYSNHYLLSLLLQLALMIDMLSTFSFQIHD